MFIRKTSKGILREIYQGNYKQCNVLEMKKGSIWGNHYHKDTSEYFYILSGRIECKIQNLKFKIKKTVTKYYSKNETFLIIPYTAHRISIIEDTVCVVLYSQKFNSKNPDLFLYEISNS